MFYVYVLYSVEYAKTYVGFTSDLNSRLVSHNHIKNKGWTKRYQPWVVLYHEEYSNKETAMHREKELKSGVGREFIKRLKQEKNS